MKAQPKVLPMVLSMGLDYLAWTQLTPMFLMWGLGIGMVGAIFLMSFLDQTFSAIDAVGRFIISLPVIGEPIEAWLKAKAEETDSKLGLEEIKAVGLWLWGALSLGFFLVSAVIDHVFGPFDPWTLGRKIRTLALACLLLLVSLIAVVAITPEQVNGGFGSAALTFSGVTVMVFVVSTWCLSIAHGLTLVARGLRSGQWAAKDTPEHGM